VNKPFNIALWLVSIMFLLAIGTIIKNSFFPSLENLVKLEVVEGGGVCMSDVLVKNLGTEDQVVLKGIIYEKEKYLGSMVSPDTKCDRIFYSNSLGGYSPPTQTPEPLP